MTKLDQDSKRTHAFTEDALGADDALTLVERLRKSEVSSEELARAARKRALQIDPTLHAIACNRPNHEGASKRFADGFFYGIPSYLKDNIAIKGLPTGFGSNAFKAKQEKHDGLYTKQILSTGLNILGKSCLPEFGFNASTEPAHTDATRNPWGLEYSSGASSGGAAALVSAGVVPFAHGNDGGGSIRIPAACCGLVGLKPSRNRHVNEIAARSLPINIVSEGILSRSVRDTAYYHFELQKHYQNKKLPKLPLVTSASKKRLRIALYSDSVNAHNTDAETRKALMNSADTLRSLGHQVDEIPIPVATQFAEDFGLYWGMLSFMLMKTARFTINKHFDRHALDTLSIGLAQHYYQNITKTPFFLCRLKQHALRFRKSFQLYDVHLSPVLGQTTRPLGELHPDIGFDALYERLNRYANFTPIANIAGTPAMSLPLGRTAHGLPIGIQLSADLGQEQTLLELAYELEEAMPWQLICDD